MPARSINFFVYGNAKQIYANHFSQGQENPYVHLASAASAGIATSTATNPIWLIKTRLQIDRHPRDVTKSLYRGTWDCLQKVVKHEGILGLYAGLSASYLGVVETSIQWVTYEFFKKNLAHRAQLRRKGQFAESGQQSTFEDIFNLGGKIGAAATAKLFAAGIAYPHEVIRTRLRQAPKNGISKYTGPIQCFNLIVRQEGILGLYSGMTAHMIRVVPNAAILFGTYELVLAYLQ